MKKRGLWITMGVLLLLAVVAIGIYVYSRTGYAPEAKTESRATSEPMATAEPTPLPSATPEPSPSPEASPTPSPEPTEEPYESPIDFAELQAVNPDIYAWLQVEGTTIDYPVLQSETDDEYYLTRNSDGAYSANGAIFSQKAYNGKTFDDPVTILYGHNMASGAMFGTLRQSFSQKDFFDANKTVTVYTPEATLTYKVFAAVPYSDELLPYEHDFTDENEFDSFFRGVFNIRQFGAQFDESNAPEAGDRVLILSTCITGTPQRFLVMAVLQQ